MYDRSSSCDIFEMELQCSVPSSVHLYKRPSSSRKISLRSEWISADKALDFWDKARATTSAVVFQRSEIRIVPSLIGMFRFGISADILPSVDNVNELESSFLSFACV